MPARDGYQNGNSNEQTAEILGYPPALAKACSDIGFSYALGLRSGEVWCFSEAITIDDVWEIGRAHV